MVAARPPRWNFAHQAPPPPMPPRTPTPSPALPTTPLPRASHRPQPPPPAAAVERRRSAAVHSLLPRCRIRRLHRCRLVQHQIQPRICTHPLSSTALASVVDAPSSSALPMPAACDAPTSRRAALITTTSAVSPPPSRSASRRWPESDGSSPLDGALSPASL
ncbi:hypothetical protein ACP4OV_012699 [Aristida adscensionis]